ncbi:MAG: hypothetical protein JXB29_08980 [Sedimentisphaerales bacterium]|nr:hypothetical protein [Sedimentisphaerales bacterium]
MELVLGIDLGTSYFKLGLFDRTGKQCGLGRVFVPKDTPDKNRSELPTDRFWTLLRKGVCQACEQAQARPIDIQAVAYSSQAGTFVLLDENNKPLTPLVIWIDRRADKIDSRVQQLWARSDFLQMTGLGWKAPEHATAKLCWFQQHQPDVWSRTAHIMTISDYLVFGLIGQNVGDAGTSSLLGLLDLQRAKWWEDALPMIGISSTQLSAQLRPGTVAGVVSTEGAERLGLKAGIPLAVGSLDHHIAAIGAGVGYVAQVSESTGTVLACLRYSNRYQPIPDCSSFCMGPGQTDKTFYQLTFSGNGASALEWYQKQFAPELTIAQLVALAETVEMGSNGLVALPSAEQYQGLEGFLNASAKHQHGSYVRAIMESTAATLVELVDSLCPDVRPEKIVATGGGAKSDLWLQIKADMLGTEFVVTDCEEPACFGAAMLAAVASGWFDNSSAIAKDWIGVKKKFPPATEAHKRYKQWYQNYQEQVKQG